MKCDITTPFMQGVFDANKGLIRQVLDEFERVRHERGVTQESVCNALRIDGGLISRQNLTKYQKGVFHQCSTTYLNIISIWCGYADCVALINAVSSRASVSQSA